MNILSIINDSLQLVNPNSLVSLFLYTGQTNSKGIVTAIYSSAISIYAQVQPASLQELKLIDGINITSIYKAFYILTNSLSGLNRQIQTGGDFIRYNNDDYKIIQVPDVYNLGWIKVVGVQGSL